MNMRSLFFALLCTTTSLAANTIRLTITFINESEQKVCLHASGQKISVAHRSNEGAISKTFNIAVHHQDDTQHHDTICFGDQEWCFCYDDAVADIEGNCFILKDASNELTFALEGSNALEICLKADGDLELIPLEKPKVQRSKSGRKFKVELTKTPLRQRKNGDA